MLSHASLSNAALAANERALQWMHDLIDSRFWGSLTFKFEAGRICHIRKEESIRPEQLSEKPDSKNARQTFSTSEADQ